MYIRNSIEDEIEVDYDTTKKVALDIDPTAMCTDEFSDWDGYIYVKESSGNSVNVTLVSVIGSIENEEGSAKPLNGNEVATFTLMKNLRHKLYVEGVSESGKIKVAYRINYYNR